jgi:ATP-dependent helicase/nuclease subunit A
MTCVLPDGEKTLGKMALEAQRPLSPRVAATASSTAQWLIWSALADGGKTIDWKLVSPESIEAPAAPAPAAAPEADPALVEALAQRLSWRYPYDAAVTLPSKLTATGIRSLTGEEDQEAASLEEQSAPRPRSFRAPDFGRQDAPLTGTERGVAAHLVMQHIDFARTDSLEAIADQIDQLAQRGFLEPRQAASVAPEDIFAFFQSDIGQRLRQADEVVREFKFSLLCPARRWFAEAPESEEILLQGVVDCCIREGESLTVIDFKTDGRICPEHYTQQLEAYAMAMERIFQRPVGEAVLWYLRRKQAVTVPLGEKIPPDTKK